MRKHIILVITALAGVLAMVTWFQAPPVLAGQNGGGGYPPTTQYHKPPPTTKPTYPVSTTYPKAPPTTQPKHHKPPPTTFPPPPTTIKHHKPPPTTFPPPPTTIRHHRPPPTTSTTAPVTTTAPTTTATTMPVTTTAPGEFDFLTLIAVVHGGPATPADFDLKATGPVDLSGITGAADVTHDPVLSGFYSLSFSEDALAMDPYSASPWSCSGDETATGESVTMGEDESATCIITFTEAAAVTTVPTATTIPVAPTAPITPEATTVPQGQTTPAVQTITPSTPVPVLSTPSSAATSLASTGYDTRLGLSSGFLLIMVGGIVLMVFRRFRR